MVVGAVTLRDMSRSALVLTPGFFPMLIYRKGRNWVNQYLMGVSPALMSSQLLSVILFILF